jgi:hypothetical protein
MIDWLPMMVCIGKLDGLPQQETFYTCVGMQPNLEICSFYKPG